MSSNPPRAILVVSGKPDSRDALARDFRLEGIEVRTAGSGDEARTVATSFSPEAAVVDLHDCDDVELALIVAIREASPWVKIVVLLPYRSLSLAGRAHNRGATRCLEKPIPSRKIVAAIQGASVSVNINGRALWKTKEEHCKRVLTEYGGNITQAARALEIHPQTLRNILGIRSESDHKDGSE